MPNHHAAVAICNLILPPIFFIVHLLLSRKARSTKNMCAHIVLCEASLREPRIGFSSPILETWTLLSTHGRCPRKRELNEVWLQIDVNELTVILLIINLSWMMSVNLKAIYFGTYFMDHCNKYAYSFREKLALVALVFSNFSDAPFCTCPVLWHKGELAILTCFLGEYYWACDWKKS